MSEEFKEKLRNYVNGTLSDEDKAEIEGELEKMEEYQAVLEEVLGDNGQQATQNNSRNKDLLTDKEAAGIVKKAKWKARFSNAITALAIIFIGTLLAGIFTSIYYSAGKPNKVSLYRDVVDSVIAVTQPNLRFRGGGNSISPFFKMELEGDLRKEVGSDHLNAGKIKLSFLFNKVGFPERETLIEDINTWPFRYPAASKPFSLDRDWEKLEKLPEGTVAEAYLSFDNFYTTDQALKKFQGKNMRLVWFVVDTGFDDAASHPRASYVGFPYNPVWHNDDWTVTNRVEEKKGLFARTVAESAQAPSVEEYGSADLRNKNFIKTLELLSDHEKIANRIAASGDLKIKDRLEYLKSHGVKIYGVVVTGPSKEILKLKNESWVAGIHLGEVRLWNWQR